MYYEKPEMEMIEFNEEVDTLIASGPSTGGNEEGTDLPEL